MNSSEESTQSLKEVRRYKCNACGKEYIRESQKKWIPSYCDATDKPARLYRGR